MAALVWHQAEGSWYESGIERGAIFSSHHNAWAAWNGLVSVVESRARSMQAFYQDGVKYFERAIPGDYAARIQAFTYPDLLDILCGISSGAFGARIHDQISRPFNLAYRTRIGNPIEGLDYGYKLHLVYNLTAVPNDVSYATMAEEVSPILFEWSVSGIPSGIADARPTSHISFDSTQTDPAVLQFVENRIYGTDATNPTMQSVSELFAALDAQF